MDKEARLTPEEIQYFVDHVRQSGSHSNRNTAGYKYGYKQAINDAIDAQIIKIKQLGYRKLKDKPPLELTPSLEFELNGAMPKYQDRLAWLLNYASAMGDYGDPHGILAVLSPQSGKVLVKESDAPE